MAAQRHQSRDDGRLAKADVSHNHNSARGASTGVVEVRVNLLKEPLAACEDGVHGDAGHLEQQRFERDVVRPIGCKTHCGGSGGGVKEKKVLPLQAMFMSKQKQCSLLTHSNRCETW